VISRQTAAAAHGIGRFVAGERNVGQGP